MAEDLFKNCLRNDFYDSLNANMLESQALFTTYRDENIV